MAKIAIVSDVHLGTRQYGIKERYDDFLKAFMGFGRSVIDKSVDAVVIGGDLFDSPRPDARSVFVAQSVINEIKDAGIKVFGIDGNHDLSDNWWLKVIGANVLIPQEATYVAGVTIGGISCKNGRDLVAEIESMAGSGIKTDILVAHFALAEMNGGGSADTGVQELSPLLDKMGVKCVLMGHVHIPDCRKWNGVLYVNPGSTEMKSINEPKEKFYFVLDTDTWKAEPVHLNTRKVEDVEISDEDDLADFLTEIENDAKTRASILDCPDKTFYQVIADDSIDDVFKRLSKTIHDTGALARIVMRSSKARDLAPVVDRSESINTLESAIEARFPKESDEAKHIRTFLASPDPASIRLSVQKFMEVDTP